MGEQRMHAVLSASGSKRWLACAPSAQLEQQFPDTESKYAAEGAFAHSLAELELLKILKKITARKYNKDLATLKNNEFYSASLQEYVNQYVTIIVERFAETKKKCKDAIILLEQKLDFSEWVPEGFGTGDVVIISDGILEIIDLKYGQGVPVSAAENTQMRLYALGAITGFGMLYSFDLVRMTIVQPRLDSISSDEITVNQLLKWGCETVKPTASKAMSGIGDFVAGEHCRFCKAKAVCKARAEANLEMAKYDFQDPAILTITEIAEILRKAEELQKWAADVQAYALEQAVNHGVKYTGWKLVEGRR